MTMQTASVGGKSVGYRIEGQGTPVVLLHGWPQTSHLWRKIVPTLAQTHRVVLVDLPGIGASDPADAWDTRSVTGLDAGIPGLVPDDLFRPENAQRVWQFFFHAVADLPEQLIADCGHSIPEERPRALLDALVPFFQTVDATHDQRN